MVWYDTTCWQLFRTDINTAHYFLLQKLCQITWRAEKISLPPDPPWGLRPVAFATSATWLIRHRVRACLCGLVAVFKATACPTVPGYGPYIWTAGYVDRTQGEANVGWRLFVPGTQIHQSISNDPDFNYTVVPVPYRRWHKNEPSNSGGHENCINVWPAHNYEWNDAPCSKSYCFVCEDRNIL